MFRKIQSRLEIKILLLIVVVLLVGFGSSVIISIQNESRALMDREKEMLRASASSLMSGIRTVMLTGKAPYALEMVNDIRYRVPFINVTIFDRFGREVFLREGEGIDSAVHDTNVREVLATGSVRETTSADSTGPVTMRYEPLVNRPECWRCHTNGAALRGALQTGLNTAVFRKASGGNAEQELARTMGLTVAAAFRTIMLGGNGEQMDTLLLNALSIPAVSLVQVYGRDGFLHFGPEEYDIPDNKIRTFTKERTIDQAFEAAGNRMRMFIPLTNDDRCQVCHGTKFPMRGVMVVDFRRNELRRIVNTQEQLLPWALQGAVSEGFRSIMLIGRANSVRFYMDELRMMPAYRSLHVYDTAGVEHFLNPPPRRLNPRQTARLTDTVEYVDELNGDPSLVRVVPIMNEQRCYACHAAGQKVRGIVEVTASLARINAEIRDRQLRSALVGLLTLLLIWLVIRFFMRIVVVRPVQIIEGVASRVGQGDFSVRASIRSIDEIGNLALKINDMVQGLRERFQLQKFVSQQTVKAIRQGEAGVDLTARRIEATVFFSDIRGFTSYSERTDAEHVIMMLNACLSQQAAIIDKHGGDIDNYVGDEVFALFEGERMVERAVLAALEIQETVIAALAEKDRSSISIGIGINTGEMVMGAMGSDERKALTVIGDNVNLGARLCGAAKGAQILLSDSSARRIRDVAGLDLRPLESIRVKGKRAPIRIYEVARGVNPAVSPATTRAVKRTRKRS